MKLKITFLFIILFGFQTFAQVITIPDANFKAKLIQANTGIQIAKNLSGQWFKVDANNDNQIQLTEATQVSALYVNFSNISDLTGIANFTSLKVLSCFNNTITSLNVTSLTQLEELYCYDNSLATLVVTGTSLKRLDCFNNTLLSVLTLTGLNTLEYLNCKQTQIVNLNVSNFTNLTNLFFGGGSYLQTLNISGCTSLTSLPYIQESVLTNFNLSNCTSLQSVDLYCNSLNNLNVSGCTSLQILVISNTALTSLNLSGLTNLTRLTCTSSPLNSLNVSGLTNLSFLNCSYNQLNALNLSGITNLTSVICTNNQLVSLNLSGLSNLTTLDCKNNQLLSLDLSECYSINQVDCRSNQLLSILMKNGKQESIDFSNNPILLYICTDDNEATYTQDKVNLLGYSNCQVNTYCSFSPGGVFYTIQGNTKLDSNLNGCDASDSSYNHLKYDITNGTITGSVVSDTSGTYSIPVTAGTHTVSPILENPSYFNVSPANAQVTFPTTASPFNQNFCITPNGVHRDLEITIVPIDAARPGFDVKYKLVYKNKGNQIANGQVSLNFQDDVLDFISANPSVSSQALNALTWNYTNLQPLETRTILFTMNLNTPMETPPLNSGSILLFTAIVNPVANDELASDNQFDYSQYVLNSFDPNDKICLEGNSITPSMAGKYLHYKIRFENTGNFAAQNIVVKDVIDLSKFDISTLQITDASHSCTTKIAEGNKIEFIFENINLPIDDANNDGYVVFKIKTKPTIVLNDVITNQANIYFDYNFPIITNVAQTIVQNPLSNSQFNLDNISVYPNPVKDSLTIEGLEIINKMELFDTSGRLLQSLHPNYNQVDLNNLKTGVYLIKIYADNKTGIVKIAKE